MSSQALHPEIVDFLSKPGIWMFASLISSSIFLVQLHGNDSAWLANQVHGHSPTASGACNVPGIYSGAISTR